MTSMRRRGRELALKIIYGFQNQEKSIEEILEEFWENFQFSDTELGEAVDENGDPVLTPVKEFAEDLARGVWEHRKELDAVITDCSTNWALERMASVDLALLRMACFELLFRHEVPVNVAINESIEIGKRYGTEETPAFINGILDRISRTHRNPPHDPTASS